MLFTEAGKSYDTASMGQYALPDSGAIYIDHEPRLIFVQSLSSDEKAAIHRATRDELEHCAARYALPELLTYLGWFKN